MSSRRIVTMVSCMVVSLSLILLVPAAALATRYSPPWVDVFGSQWSDLNTTGAAADFVAYLSTGYTRYTELNKTASIAMGPAYAQSDAIWVDFGHGGPGYITFCSPPNGANCTTVLRSNFDCSKTDGVCMSAYGTSIHYIKLMVFAGCHTGNTPSGGRNLLDQAVTYNGADSAIGFTDYIYFGGGDQPDHYWATTFAHRLTVGDSLNAAANVAWQNVAMHNILGNAYGWDSRVTRNGGATVMPPAYGS